MEKIDSEVIPLKYLHQILLIFGFSFLGELLRSLIPLPIPASIYGMILLFLALSTGIVKLDHVKAAGNFLTSFFPVLFVAPVVSLIDCWEDIKTHIVPILLVMILSAILCFFVSGKLTQHLMKKRKEDHHD